MKFKDLPRGKVFDVFITNVDENGEFFVVKKSNEKILVDIANQLQQLAESRRLKPLENVQLGQEWAFVVLNPYADFWVFLSTEFNPLTLNPLTLKALKYY